jgi:hypothetical protein
MRPHGSIVVLLNVISKTGFGKHRDGKYGDVKLCETLFVT